MKFVYSILTVLLIVFSVSADTLVVPDGGNVQAAINAAKFGDTIKLTAGSTYDTPSGFNLTDKGTPVSTARDCGVERILITTTDPSGTPAALSNYPQNDVLITTAMAARMPHVRATAGAPAVWVNPKAKCWVVERLDITSVPGSNTLRLVGLGEQYPTSIADFPDRITFQLNWGHPPEETGGPATADNLNRSAENFIYFEGTRTTIRQNGCQGFVKKLPSGERIATSCFLGSSWMDDLVVENNRLEAWTYPFFIGGGGKGFSKPDSTGTVSACTSTSCVFSSVKNLIPNKPVAIRVYTYTDSSGVLREVWGTMRVSSIEGNKVNFKAPLCWSGNDPNANRCLPFTANNPQQIPSDGSPVRWDGYQPQNIAFRRNIVTKRDEWVALMNNNCGGKGYFEIKAFSNSVIQGNIFQKCTGPAVTARNQAGADPWNNFNNLEISYNWFKDGNGPFTMFGTDDANLTEKSLNVRIHDNLAEREFADPGDNNYYRVIANGIAGANGLSITHNTTLVGSYRAYTSSANEQDRIDNFVNRDNFYLAAPNVCFTDPSGTAGAPLTSCWPNADVSKNVLIKTGKWGDEEIKNSWLQYYPNNWVAASISAVGFANPDLSAKSLDNYRLLPTSPYYRAGSDGKDIGADIDAMKAMIFGGDVSLPTPTPSASPAASPVASPTPVATPTATPVPTPVPTPSPQPGKISISGQTLYSGGGVFSFTTVQLWSPDVDGKKVAEMQEGQDGKFSFSVDPGTYALKVVQGDYNTNPSKILFPNLTGDVIGIVITVGPVSSFSAGPVTCIPSCASPTPTPTATPTPVSTPAPVPSPSVTPTPTPTPTPSSCVMTIEAPTLTPGGSGILKVAITSPIIKSFTVSAIAAGGQVTVSPPTSKPFSNVTKPVEALFTLRAKKKEGWISVSGPCGSESVLVSVQ